MSENSFVKKIDNLIGGKEVLAYSLTLFGASMVGSLMGSAISFFYTDVLLIGPATVGIIFLISRIWDAVNDPMIGLFIDRTRTKRGKCLPYLRVVPIPLLIVAVFMFLPIGDLSPTFKAVSACLFYILYDTFYTAIDIPMNGLQSLLFIEQEHRNKAVSVSSTLGSLGTILPSGLYFILVTLIGGNKTSPKGNFIVATSIIAIGCFCISFSTKFLKEKIVIEPKKEKISIAKTFKALFTNKPLFILLLVSLFAAPMGMSSNALVYFCNWNFIDSGIPSEILFPLLQISSGAAWPLSVLAVPFFLKRTTKKKLFIYMSIAGIVLNTALYFLGYHSIILYLIVKFFASFPCGIIATLTTLLISDSVEYVEWKTGERTEGMTFAIIKFVGKVSGALISSLTMFMLAFVKYNPEVMQTTKDAGMSVVETYPDVLNMIFVLMTLTLSVAFLLQVIPMFFYKFDGAEQERALAELKERREREHTLVE